MNTSPHDAAIDSVWVSASAGTGKTHVLTDRVLRLLLSGTAPARILCLTFTKAAAAEMANRIHHQLGVWARADDPTLRAELADFGEVAPDDERLDAARRLFAAVLDAPGGLKIQTIHAFCDSLLARFPLEAGLAPHFTVMDERTAAEHLDLAIDAVLREARQGADDGVAAAVARLSTHVNQRAFTDLMAALLRERGRLRRMTGDSLVPVAKAINRALGVEDGGDDGALVAAACADDALDLAGLAGAADALGASTPGDRERGARLRDWLHAPARRAAEFDRYAGVFLTQEGAPRQRLLSRRAAAAWAKTKDILDREASRLVALGERRKALAVSVATLDLLRVGQAVDVAYEGIKRRQARLDYDDLVLQASALLGDGAAAAWILFKLDGGLDHILIDEAQDTNPEQWRIIAALTEEFFAGHGARETERTLFAVGDPKQSIYGFQRADPAQFSHWRRHFGERIGAVGKLWRSVDLVTSFRSTVPVLTAVDAVFGAPEARDGLLFDGGWLDHESNRRGQAGVVELWPIEEPSEPPNLGRWRLPLMRTGAERPSARLARRIAARIREGLERGELLPSRGRPLAPGDIMILVQWRSRFLEEMVRALKQARVAVAGADRMVLTEQIAVMDLMAFGHFLLLPDDDLNLAVVLKSPLVGWDEEQLYALAEPRGERTLWRALIEASAHDPRCRRARAFLGHWLGRADFAPPYELYAELLGAAGARRRLIARLGAEANEPIDEFLARALDYEQAGPPSLQGFLHWLSAGRAEVKRDLDHGRGEVRVMTVHGAKGLQAPIVFLPDTCRVPRQSDPLLWLDEDGPVLWPGRRDREDAVCREARAAADRRRDQEYRRLLYVAMTRAEDRLYVCGWRMRHQPPAHCWYELTRRGLTPIAGTFDAGGGRTGYRIESPQLAPPDRTGEAPSEAEDEAGPPDWLYALAPVEASPALRLAPSRPTEDEPPVRSPLGELATATAGYRRGNLIHRLLETLPELPVAARAAAAERFLARPLHALEPAARREIADETLAILHEPAFASLFGPGSRAEVPLIGVVGEAVISGRIDRLLVSADAVSVIDYKTNREPPASAAEVVPVYLRQMAAYRALLRQIYPAKEVRCALLWTATPRLMALDPARLDAYAPMGDGVGAS